MYFNVIVEYIYVEEIVATHSKHTSFF